MKKIFVLLIFLLLFLITSCSNDDMNGEMDDAANGVSFDYFNGYEVEGVTYEIYLPNDFNNAFYYGHKLGNVKSDSAEWKINFIYDVNYHVDEEKENKEVWNGLYLLLFESKNTLDEKCDFDVEIFDPNANIEMEFELINNSEKEAEYVIFYTFLPIRIYNTNTRETYTVGIPLYVDVLLKIDNMVTNPFTSEMISWEDFLAI